MAIEFCDRRLDLSVATMPALKLITHKLIRANGARGDGQKHHDRSVAIDLDSRLHVIAVGIAEGCVGTMAGPGHRTAALPHCMGRAA